MSLTLPIQVGKQYVRRDGAVVTAHPCPQPGVAIVKIGDKELKREAVYTKNGRWSIVSDDYPFDLIADHIPTTGHPHAALMAQYAADAAETAEPWLRWEYFHNVNNTRETVAGSPLWKTDCEYRRKPKTIRIGEHDVPEPFRGELPAGASYWMIRILNGKSYPDRHANGTISTGREHVASGLVHLTREAAEQHARALLAFTQVQA